MILKYADDKSVELKRLKKLCKNREMGVDSRKRVETELRKRNSGVKGEKEVAYFVNFHFAESEHVMVIHDLRLELPDGRSAQIDHIVIDSNYCIYVLEIKNTAHQFMITGCGEFLRFNAATGKYEGMGSPIEQGIRHALVLAKSLDMLGLPRFQIVPMVLLPTNVAVERSVEFDSSMVVKADQFYKLVAKNSEGINSKNYLSGLERPLCNLTVEEVGRKLVKLHKPIVIKNPFMFSSEEGLVKKAKVKAFEGAWSIKSRKLDFPVDAPIQLKGAEVCNETHWEPPSTTAHQSRLQLFQPTRRPDRIERVINTEWGWAKVVGKIGQGHADIMEAICWHTENSPIIQETGQLHLLVDPYRVRVTIGGGKACSGDTLNRMIDDLKEVTITLEIKAQQLKVCGGILTRINQSSVTRINPLTGQQRFLWDVTLDSAFASLLSDDLKLRYDPAALVKMETGVSQAIARHIFTHRSQPCGGWYLDTLIRLVGAGGDSVSIRNRRREVRKDIENLRAVGIIVAKDRVYRSHSV